MGPGQAGRVCASYALLLIKSPACNVSGPGYPLDRRMGVAVSMIMSRNEKQRGAATPEFARVQCTFPGRRGNRLLARMVLKFVSAMWRDTYGGYGWDTCICGLSRLCMAERKTQRCRNAHEAVKVRHETNGAGFG